LAVTSAVNIQQLNKIWVWLVTPQYFHTIPKTFDHKRLYMFTYRQLERRLTNHGGIWWINLR